MNHITLLFVLPVAVFCTFPGSEEPLDDTEFDLLEVNSLIDSIVAESNQTVTERIPTENSDPINWCAWFEETDFRIGAYQVLANTQQVRLGLYDVPINIIRKFIAEIYAIQLSKEDLIASGANVELDEWGRDVVERLVNGVRPWLKSTNPQPDKLQTRLYSGLVNLATKTDMTRFRTILGKFVIVLEEGRANAHKVMIDDAADGLKLIQEVKANAGLIRACLEHHLKLVGEERLSHAKRLVHMESVMTKIDVLRERVVKRIQTLATSASIDVSIQRKIKTACAESVKRIVFSEKRAIATELQTELTLVAHNNNFRTLTPVLPVYLGALDDVRVQLAARQQKQAPGLTQKRDQCDRFLGETRKIVAQLDTYISR